ncbi:MAG: hydroxymethylbilane synthase [Alphaproteobacteria bacterium]|nr:hydroxymethylbilane synthase [Alphaproteobacteria bacterium]
MFDGTPLRLRIGTRASPMALYQANLVRDRLLAEVPYLAAESVELVPMRTTGDIVLDRPLAEIGGKGLFTKELERALTDRRIDIAVHSLKDVETRLAPGLMLGAILGRDDPRDALLSRDGRRLDELPSGAVIGTASPRRRAQLLRHRPDLRIVPFRGNAGTRLGKLAAGEVDATLLALCGLRRLKQEQLITEILPPDVMLPAVGQGALAIECRSDDDAIRRCLTVLHDPQTAACVSAERAMLDALGGDCYTPVAGLAQLADGKLTLEGRLFDPAGKSQVSHVLSGSIADAIDLGRRMGGVLRQSCAIEFAS